MLESTAGGEVVKDQEERLCTGDEAGTGVVVGAVARGAARSLQKTEQKGMLAALFCRNMKNGMLVALFAGKDGGIGGAVFAEKKRGS